MNDGYTRALFRYFRDNMVHIKKETILPDLQAGGFERFNYRHYVVIRAVGGSVLRVYRVRSNGLLRQVLPWPRGLDQPPRETFDPLYCRLDRNFQPLK